MRRIVIIFIALCVIFASTNQGVAAQPTTPVTDKSPFWVRTHVQVNTPAQWRDLARLGVVILERGDDWALLLADDEQLESLARWRFNPEQTNALESLGQSDASLSSSIKLLSLQAKPRLALRRAMLGLTAQQRLDFTKAAAVDSDDDGLTDTQEGYWCTDPARADSDLDGSSDGNEVKALKAWMNNERAQAPSTGKPFQGWPPQKVGCFDDDQDSVPDQAEGLELGLNPSRESTDRDKFDDGQELFGQTYCTGQGGFCSYGPLPRNEDWGVIFAEMPSWVKAPGHHPLVAAFPVPAIDIAQTSLKVEAVTTITTDRTISSGTEKSYSTAKTEGTSTSVADTVMWNEWQEVSVTSPVFNGLSGRPSSNQSVGLAAKLLLGFISTAAKTAWKYCTSGKVSGPKVLSCAGLAEMVVNGAKGAYNNINSWFGKEQSEPTELRCNTTVISCQAQIADSNSGSEQNQIVHQGRGGDQNNLHNGSETLIKQTNGTQSQIAIYDLSFPLLRPAPTVTQSNGKSWGGAQTTTNTNYEEYTVTNGEAFSTEEAWGTATAINSSHTADLRFSYVISNTGTEYAREIANLAFNLYIGDDTNPVYTYFVAQDIGGSGKFQNFMPGETHQYASRPVPLSLEQMKAIDLGAPIRIVVEDFTYGIDELFYLDAVNAGILFAIEDGKDDGDETIDTYLVPTWGQETVLQALGRAFPNAETDSDGTITAIWTPEYRTDTPAWCQAPRRPTDFPSKALRCKHTLSTADWWNVYTDGLGNGGEGFQDTPAVPGAVAFFRFNKDTDLDGFSDRTEIELGTDPRDATVMPRPELLVGLHNIRNGNKVTSTLSLRNNGVYDAYGVEAVMIAPDDSINITNNTVGGSGRVRALNQVIVGSRVQLQTPLPVQWQPANHAKPANGGYYTGNTDRTYTFTVNCSTPGGCTVGSGAWSVAWVDGVGASGTLNFGAGYASPNFVAVGNFGLTLALYSGSVNNGESFTVAATTPRDTFQYTINRQPYTEPLVIVSYNDPQGNHRFVLPSSAMSLTAPTDNLSTFAGQMLSDVGVEIVTSAPFTAGLNSVKLLVNNPTSATLSNAHLFIEFIDLAGTVVHEKPLTMTIAPGPQYVQTSFNTADFSPTYSPTQDYIAMAFWTDYQGNIVDTSGRPLSSFQADPLPKLIADSASLDWNFGTVKQGMLLKHSVALANTGFGRLYTYLPPTPGLSLNAAARSVGAADISDYELTLRTAELTLGPYDQIITIATSDPMQPMRSLRVRGTIVAGTADTAGGISRPLDVSAAFGANLLGTWQTFNYTLGPDASTLHPVKVFNSVYANPPFGVGKFATEFGAGTASADMFGDGRDGVMPSSGNLDNDNGSGFGVVNSAIAGSMSINVTNAYGVYRINPGDVVLIHQTQGTGAGQWELNKAATDFTEVGTFSLQKPLQYSYSTSGNNKAQILRVPQYSSCNTLTGTYAPTIAWNGSHGGIFVAMCNSPLALNGTISVNGGNGVTANDGDPLGGSSGGFRGGIGNAVNNDNNGSGNQGEGTASIGTYNPSANGNGGGAGAGSPSTGNYGTGGGGGNANAGTNSSAGGIGIGGQPAGNSELTSMVFGGGGGGSNDNPGNSIGGGGGGGGIVVLLAPTITINGSISTNGGNGAGNKWGGGGGAGGSILLRGLNVNVNTNKLSAVGGSPGPYGGAGSQGRIRVEFCESGAGSTNPGGSFQKLNCYIADQVSNNPQQGQLNIPSNTAQIYQIQYGRKLNFASAGNQLTQLRLPAGLLGSISMEALISGLSGNTTLSLDVGDDGSVEWSQSVGNNSMTSISNNDLTTAFSAYWAAHSGTNTGTLDVPVRVSLAGAGQVLLTNLQTQLASSSLRYIKLNAGTCTEFLLDFTAGSSGSVLAAIDIGDNGSIDWTAPAAAQAPKRWQTGDLKTAVNAYLTGKNGEVEMPIRIYITPSGSATLNDFSASFAAQTDVAAVGISLPPTANALAQPEAATYNAGDVLTLQANLGNTSGANSGPLTVAFFAHAEGWGDWYVGSAFINNIAPGGNATISTTWNTTGFGGDVPVKVVVNPYGRVGETNLANNTKSMTVTIVPLKVDQTITFAEIPSKTVGDGPFDVNVSTSSGLTVTVTSLTSNICTVLGNTVTLTGQRGICTLQASQIGNLFYHPAVSVERSFAVGIVGGLVQTITFAPLGSKIFGDAPFTVSASASSNLPVRFESATAGMCGVSGNTVTVLTVGTCIIRALQDGDNTFNPATPVEQSFTVAKANQSIVFNSITDKRLSESPVGIAASANSGLPITLRSSTTTVCAVVENTASLLQLGTCTIEASQTGNSNVNAAESVVRSFNIVGGDPSKYLVYLPVLRR